MITYSSGAVTLTLETAKQKEEDGSRNFTIHMIKPFEKISVFGLMVCGEESQQSVFDQFRQTIKMKNAELNSDLWKIYFKAFCGG